MREVKGNFMIEGILGVFVFLILHLLLVEAVRRSVYRVALGHLVCEEVRMKALGENNSSIVARSISFLKKALSVSLAKKIIQKTQPHFYQLFDSATLKRLNLPTQGGGVTERHFRYPQFIHFRMKNNQEKHHQELTVRCLFPFSS